MSTRDTTSLGSTLAVPLLAVFGTAAPAAEISPGFTARCGGCHGADGRGGVPLETVRTAEQTVEFLQRNSLHESMVKQLEDAEIRQLAAAVAAAVTAPNQADETSEPEVGAQAASTDAARHRRLWAELEIGARGIDDVGSAKFDQYREISEGVYGALRFGGEDESGRHYLEGRAYDIAEDDQQYALRFGAHGQWRVIVDYQELPHVFSNQGRSPYLRSADIALVLPTAFDRGTFAGGGVAAEREISRFAKSVALGFDTNVANGKAEYKLGAWVLDLGFGYIERDGTRPLGLGFGSPGGNFVNFAGPIDDETLEFTAGAEILKEHWNFSIDYTGSWYANDLRSVTVDNPSLALPTLGESNRGRLSLAPDNSSHTVTASGAYLFSKGRLAGTFGYSRRTQDEPFLPHTINPLIDDPGLLLPRNSLDGEMEVLLGNAVLSLQPLRRLNVDVRYRYHDHDNQTEPLLFGATVRSDASLRSEREFVGTDFRSHKLEAKASYRVFSRTTIAPGFMYKNTDRSGHREVEDMDEYGPTLEISHRINGLAKIVGRYAFERRAGDYRALLDADADTRRFDLSERDQHRLKLLATVNPVPLWSLTFSGGYQRDDFTDGRLEFGLEEIERWNVGVDVSGSLSNRVTVSGFYNYDRVGLKQRQQGFQTRTTDDAHNLGLGLSAQLIPDKLDADFSFALQTADADTDSSDLEPGTGAVDYPTLEDTLNVFNASLTYRYREDIRFNLLYRYEDYEQSDFQYDNLGLGSLSSQVNGSGDLFLANPVADYDTHIIGISVSLSY